MGTTVPRIAARVLIRTIVAAAINDETDMALTCTIDKIMMCHVHPLLQSHPADGSLPRDDPHLPTLIVFDQRAMNVTTIPVAMEEEEEAEAR